MKRLLANDYFISFITIIIIIIILCIPEIYIHKSTSILDDTWWLTDQALAVMPALEDLYKHINNHDFLTISDNLFLGIDLYSRNILPIFNPFIWIFSVFSFDKFFILLHSSSLAIGVFSTFIFAREVLKTNIILSLFLSILYTIHPIWREQTEIFIHAAGINFFPLLIVVAIKSMKNKGNVFLVYISMVLFLSYIFGGWIFAPFWFSSFFVYYFFLNYSSNIQTFNSKNFILKIIIIISFFIGFSAFVLLPQLFALVDSSRLLAPVHNNSLKIWANSILGFGIFRSTILFTVGIISIYLGFFKKIKQTYEIKALYKLSAIIFLSLCLVLISNYFSIVILPNSFGEITITRFYFVFDLIFIVIIGNFINSLEKHYFKVTSLSLKLIIAIILIFSSFNQNYLWSLNRFTNFDQLNKFRSKDTTSEINFLKIASKEKKSLSILVQMPSLNWNYLNPNNKLFMPGYLAGNLPLHFDLATCGGYVNNSPLRLVNFRKQLLYKDKEYSSSVGYIPNFHNSLLNLPFDYLLMRDNYEKLDTSHLKLSYIGNDYTIWKNLKPLPLFYNTTNIINSNYDIALKNMLSFNLQDTIAYIENFSFYNQIKFSSNQNLKSNIIYNKINSGFYELNTITNLPSVIIFTNLYTNGWKSSIDGINTHIFPVNYLYQAVYVSPGKHKIIFQYETPGLKIGIIISLFFALYFFYNVFKSYSSKKYIN